MPDPEELEAIAIADAVEAGTDAIDVPQELIDEPDRTDGPLHSLYAKILTMTIGEKIKLALRGNKDARMILIRDTNKLIRRFVLRNPRIGDEEIIAICRNRTADEDALRVIANGREWMRNYQIRLALTTNPKTPLVLSMRQVPTLSERDIRQLAKSKNVPQAVAAQCRRILFTMRPGTK
jgi:hypothetical protein